MTEKFLTVLNRAGIHARPAALIAQTANKFSSEITIEKDSASVNAKSIMGVITMAAGHAPRRWCRRKRCRCSNCPAF